jgi:hypothetical protein
MSARLDIVEPESPATPESIENFADYTIDPGESPDEDEPDPENVPWNARYHGHCGTCAGNQELQVLMEKDAEPVWVTCFACGGTGLAEDEKLCPACKGNRCNECGRTGLAVDVPYDEPDAYWLSDPWTSKDIDWS